MTAETYCNNKAARNKASYHYRPTGLSYWLIDGQKFDDTQIESLYPINVTIGVVKDNSDKRKMWMKDKKSF